MLTIEDLKNYLRVDFDDDDKLISELLVTAEKLCADILRTEQDNLYECRYSKTAVMYTIAYLYENREKADYNSLSLTLRSLLSANRQEEF